MKRFILILCTFLCLAGCKPVHQVVVEHVYETHITDSIRYHDSTVVVPQEVYTNLAWKYDSLHLETSLAVADCWVDSLWLKGTIKNKKEVVYKYVEVEKWRDSIVYEKVPDPYPVEVMVEKPLNNKLLTWSILASLGLLVSLCWIFRKWIIKLFV